MSKNTKWAIAIGITVAIVGLLAWTFVAGRQEAATEAERERPIEAPSRVHLQNGQLVIQMSPEEQNRNGIAVSPLKAIVHAQELRGTAVVLPIQELTDLRNTYLANQAQVQKSQAALAASRQQFTRLQALYENERNASLTAVQAAQATASADEAAVNTASAALVTTESTVRQRWGTVIADWLFSGSPAFERLVRLQDLLIQVALPPEQETAPPHAANIRTPQGKLVSAKLVSLLPRLDPRIQAPSYLYVTPNRPDLIPGMNLLVLMPSGVPVRGVVVPRTAIVWWQGRAWAYVKTTPNQFVQHEISTDTPVPDGWFLTSGLAAGESVVTAGAQQLLSEQFRSQIQVGGEETK